ncbi:MAG: hypothetical protein PHP50_11720 [Lachnospiraceae bacterium]|nr:hypothetical protein [Lachnospiraceae bacterium]
MKKKYTDPDYIYSEEEIEALHDWIVNHLEPAKKIHFANQEKNYFGFPYKSLDTLISGADIELLASLDLGRLQGFDCEIIRIIMSEIDLFPIRIPGSPIYYYRALWKNITAPGSSEKWRIE